MGDLLTRNEEPDFYSSEEENEMPQQTSQTQSQLLIRNDDINFTLDSDAVTHLTLHRCTEVIDITLSDIREIDKELEDYEKISLIFLLSENVQDCLDNMSLYQWAKKEVNVNNNWQAKLFEAFAIIKNFEIPKRYGFTKAKLIEEYFPYSYFTSRHVSKLRKILFFVCEQLNEGNENIFLQKVETDFIKKHLTFIRYSQLEIYFSYFLKINYITEANVKNCSMIFKIMGFEEICDWLNRIPIVDKKIDTRDFTSSDIKDRHDKSDRSNYFDNTTINDRSLLQIQGDRDISLAESGTSNSTQDNAQTLGRNVVHTSHSSINSDDIYDMNGNKICFIINQENFYTETDEEYKDLLPDSEKEEQLHRRQGTFFDSERLKNTFEQRHFQVETAKNLTHLSIICELKRVVQQIDGKNCSCFFVFILSHGDEGVVFGCNSCRVEVSDIIEIMCHKKLNNVPKVLILQSCQGSTLQTIVRMNDNIDLDGPSKFKPTIKDPNFLLFSSSVPGFSSIRDKQTGTWFIQSLCNQLDKDGDCVHFEDICTNIIRDVSQKKLKRDKNTECFMLPIKETTLTKKLFLRI